MDGFCNRCKKSYLHTYPDGSQEPDNNLLIAFSGGYGQFTDTTIDLIMASEKIPVDLKPELTEEGVCLTCAFQYQVSICHECAHELCDWLGIPRETVKEWHSHKTSYVEQNPDHFGWDYDSRAKGEI